MSAITTTCRRTISRSLGEYLSPLSVGLFLAAVAALFAFRLDAAEGSRQSVTTIWTLAVSQLLPVLTAFLAMEVWSEERHTRRVDLLLSIAVRERDYVVGKVFGVWLEGAFAVLLSFGVVSLELSFFAPSALAGVHLSSALASLAVLLLQNALWCSAAVAFSAMFRRAFAAAVVSIFVLAVLPRSLHLACVLWSPRGAAAFGEMPIDAMAADFSSGIIATSAVGSFAVLSWLSLFIATRSVLLTRFSGVGSRGRRATTLTSIFLSLLVTASIVLLLGRLDATIELPIKGGVSFSPRMRHILSESSGEMSVTAFLSRRDPSFRTVARFLRTLKRQADSSMGLDLAIRFVDPQWDLGGAERLIRRGVKEGSLVFEKGRRSVTLSVDEGADERAVISAIQRLVMPPQRRNVYWTYGHGEAGFETYGSWGMSDIARELVRNGYRNQALDLASDQPIPADCALIVIAGAKDSFSRTERVRLDTYLKRGGRLLVLMDSSGEGGIAEMLPSWGVRFLRQPIIGAPTLSGTDVLAADFADHPLSSALKGSRIVLERPLVFENLAVAEGATGADRLEVTPLVSIGTSALVMAVERGGTVGSDLAIRPTRIVVVGDASFVMNGQLSARGNANRDLFLNAVAYLSGTDAMGASGLDTEVLVTGLDRASRRRFAIISIGVTPLLIGLLLALFSLCWRSRK